MACSLSLRSSGFQMRDYRSHLMAKFEPFVDSALRIVLTSGYAVALTMSAILAFHVAGWTVSRCLRLRSPSSGGSAAVTRCCYRLGGGSGGNGVDGGCPAAAMHRRSNATSSSIPADSSVQMFIPHHRAGNLDDVMMNEDAENDASDYDDADVIRFDTSLTTSPRRTATSPRVYGGSGGGSSSIDASGQTVTSPMKAVSLTLRSNETGDFKYSETNV
jgi:hypothetical protein